MPEKPTHPTPPVVAAPQPDPAMVAAVRAAMAPAAPPLADPNAPRPDTTVPGGRYRVGDQLVNADGEPLKEEKG